MANIGKRQIIGLFLGPLVFLLLLLLPTAESMSPSAAKVAAITALMTVWWITEAIPIPITALLPIALFPLLGIMKPAQATAPYANHLIYLFLGGFFIAVTIEKWNLHKRIALHTIKLVGTSPDRIVMGFMLATAFLSMWISNTATTMMMLPIGIAVVGQASNMLAKNPIPGSNPLVGNQPFGTALMLGIAYSASIGGVASLIGTPPNAILAGVYENMYGQSIDFSTWLKFGVPLSSIMLIGTWLYLTKIAYPSKIKNLPSSKELIQHEIKLLGPMSKEEFRVLLVFIFVASAWILRGIIKIEAFAMVKDSTIAIFGACLLFLIPSNFKKGEFLLDWRTALKVPWDVIILFGGGFAIATGFSESGLTQWIASQLALLKGMPILLMIGIISFFVIFLTEVTSNTASASLLIPIMGALAQATNTHPLGLMISTAVAASFAFMLPVATPPNAIVYGSHCVTIPQMAKAGFWVNIAGGIILTLFVIYVLPLVWGIELLN
mgnify:CR=1 FL=1|jgi:solute carrier family 13 (sodium-dependent dicarboxylate transporter), member 2/3/5